MTKEYKPDALSLDLHLPDIDGWRRVLDRLKNDVVTRHIPVCVISTDEARDRALASGVLAFVAKPIQSRDTLDALLGRIADFHRTSAEKPAGRGQRHQPAERAAGNPGRQRPANHLRG